MIPVTEFRLQETVTEVARLSTIFGFVGGFGKVAGSEINKMV